MNHFEAQELLSQFAEGALDSERESAIRSHSRGCSECREWLAASSFLARSMEPAGAHPSGWELSLYGLLPEQMSDSDLERCREHVATCRECRQELSLVVGAAEEARSEDESGDVEPIPLSFPAAAPAPASRLRIALAAGLAVAAGAWLLAQGLSVPPDEKVVSGQVLDGDQTVSARRSIVVDDTVVDSGARVVFEGGDRVAFGDGFTVGSGANLTVATSGKNNDDSAST